MTGYFLGVDAGATKSHVMITDEVGKVASLVTVGTGNPDWVGLDGFVTVLQDGMEEALSLAHLQRAEIVGAGFGIAGYDWPSQRSDLLAGISGLGLDCPVALVNDTLVALMAGASQGWGVAVIAGTSCNAWGVSPDGRFGRMSGYSWLGEYAGAHELVEKALQAVTKAWTRRGPSTALTQILMRAVGATCEDDLIEGVSLQKYQIDASAAPLIFAAANDGDLVAEELVRWAGTELGDLAVGVIRQLNLFDLVFDVVLSGSFYRGSPLLQREMEQVVHACAPRARFVPLTMPSVVGGVLLGMQAAALSPDRICIVRETIQNDLSV